MDIDEYDALPDEWPIRTHMLAGAAAGVMEHTVMYPVDCIKVWRKIVLQCSALLESVSTREASSLLLLILVRIHVHPPQCHHKPVGHLVELSALHSYNKRETTKMLLVTLESTLVLSKVAY